MKRAAKKGQAVKKKEQVLGDRRPEAAVSLQTEGANKNQSTSGKKSEKTSGMGERRRSAASRPKRVGPAKMRRRYRVQQSEKKIQTKKGGKMKRVNRITLKGCKSRPISGQNRGKKRKLKLEGRTHRAPKVDEMGRAERGETDLTGEPIASIKTTKRLKTTSLKAETIRSFNPGGIGGPLKNRIETEIRETNQTGKKSSAKTPQ